MFPPARQAIPANCQAKPWCTRNTPSRSRRPSPACCSSPRANGRQGAYRPIGTPPELYEGDPSIRFRSLSRRILHGCSEPRASDSNKGMYGHVLVIAGGRGKTGAAAMAGIAALRAGAGLSTVASAASAISAIASYAPEIMTEPLAETDAGSIAMRVAGRSGARRDHRQENRDRDRSGHGPAS